MTKTELINSIADKASCTKKDAASALEATLTAIQGALESGEKVNNIEAKPVDETTPEFRDINIENIVCRHARRAMYFNGLPEKPITNIHLKNIQVSAEVNSDFFNCENVTKENVNLTIEK